VKTFRGNEGYGLNATLLRDGKKVCEIIDDANGGMWNFHWFDGVRGESAEMDLFAAFIEGERAKIPADAVDKEYPDLNLRKSYSGETWVNKEAIRMEHAKQMRREFKKYTCFQVGAAIGGQTWKRIVGHGPAIIAHIEKTYGAQGFVIMNDQPEWK
jgi:hypothetical protein